MEPEARCVGMYNRKGPWLVSLELQNVLLDTSSPSWAWLYQLSSFQIDISCLRMALATGYHRWRPKMLRCLKKRQLAGIKQRSACDK